MSSPTSKADVYDQIRRTIDYIEQHLDSDLSLGKLAEIACFSPFHYHRVFLMLVGDPVMEYVRKRRLARAAYAVAHTDDKLVDIAFAHGFGSHETFLRAFRRLFGMTPGEYRKKGFAPPLYAKAEIRQPSSNPYLGGIRMDYQLLTKPAFHFIGYELRTTTCDGQNHKEIPAFWQDYLQGRWGERIPDRVHTDTCVELGICTDMNMESGEFSYLIGMEATGLDHVPEGLVGRTFPEATYAVFTTPPGTQEQFSNSIQSTWRAIFAEWFPHSGYEHAGTPEFELYDERCHVARNPDNLQMDIYVPIKPKSV